MNMIYNCIYVYTQYIHLFNSLMCIIDEQSAHKLIIKIAFIKKLMQKKNKTKIIKTRL